MAACEMWTAVAPDWDRLGDRVEQAKADVTARVLAAAGPLEGARVLELGAGTGRLALRLAEGVGPAGSVHATDAADGMVLLLKHRLDGHEAVTVGQVDAGDLPFDDASLDVVVFRMGLMMVPDAASALRDIRRVLSPGGRFVTAVWADAAHNPWLTTVGMAAMAHGLVSGPPPVGPGGPFSLGDPEQVRGLFETAGFVDVEVEVVDSVHRYADTVDHVDMVRALAPPLSAAIGRATTEQVDALRSTVADLTAEHQGSVGERGSRAVPARALVARGTAP